MRTIFTFLLALSFARCWSLDPNHFAITRTTAPYFIVDGNAPAVNYTYNSFELAGIYPNPFTGYTAVTVFSDKPKLIQITLYDMNGKEVLEKDHTGVAGTNIIFVDQLASLPCGTYLLQVKMGDEVRRKKIVKER